MRDWYAQHHVEGESDRQTLRQFTHELQSRLQQVTIHLEDQQWQEWLADLEHLAPQIPLSGPTRVPKLRRRKQIADAMNYFLNQDSERALAVADQIRAYCAQARQIGLTPASQVLHGNRPVAWGQWFLHLLAMTAAAIPATVGLVFHILPFWISRHGAKLFTPPGRTAVSLYRLLVGFPVFLIWYLLALLLLLKFLPPVWAVVAWLILPWLGIFSYHYWASAPADLARSLAAIPSVDQPRTRRTATANRDRICRDSWSSWPRTIVTALDASQHLLPRGRWIIGGVR